MQYQPESPERRPQNVSGIILLVLSLAFPPGANYMYMGLIKRGLAAMCAFFMLIFLIVAADGGIATVLFALSLPVLWFASFFDGFHIKRRINAGEAVPDGIDDVISTMRNNKAITLVIIFIVGLTFAGNFLDFAVQIVRRTVPIALILLALYVIFRKRD